MLPELFYTQSLTLIFFLLVVIVLIVAFIHHYLQEKIASHRPPHQLVHDHVNTASFPHPTDGEVDDLESYYKDHLEEVATNLQKRFDSDIQKATESFMQYLDELKVKADQTQSILDAAKTDRVNAIFTHMEQTMAAVVDKAVTQSIASIQLDLETSKKSVEDYTKKQLSIVDQNIIDLLERTLSLVLVKKLSLREQLDLVYEALEKAKAEGFLALPTQGTIAAAEPPPAEAPADQKGTVTLSEAKGIAQASYSSAVPQNDKP
jgi:hypothetical protein